MIFKNKETKEFLLTGMRMHTSTNRELNSKLTSWLLTVGTWPPKFYRTRVVLPLHYVMRRSLPSGSSFGRLYMKHAMAPPSIPCEREFWAFYKLIDVLRD